jgi:hypothetical protein
MYPGSGVGWVRILVGKIKWSNWPKVGGGNEREKKGRLVVGSEVGHRRGRGEKCGLRVPEVGRR